MTITKFGDMVVVPEKFSTYTIEKTTEKSAMVQSGIATPDHVTAQLMNGLPEGGRFITVPFYNPLEGEDDVFSEDAMTPGKITTGSYTVPILMRQKAWGSSDLAHVMGGSDPMEAITELVSDWWTAKEQAIYLSILKGVLDPTAGALKAHVNDISALSGDDAKISVAATLDTKQTLGDHADALGMVFMHSAVYTALQKNQQIATEYDATLQIQIQTYLGYRVIRDDSMPVSEDGTTYTTYFLGAGAFMRQDGSPSGFVGTETDRDKLGSANYLINRRCMTLHLRGLSWNTDAEYPEGVPYPTNAMLANPANWTLKLDAKKVAAAALIHKI